jgi:hypothetical protein
MFALRKLCSDLLGLVVTAADPDHFGAEESRFPKFFLRHKTSHEHPEFDARPRTGRGISHRGIASGGYNRFTDVALAHGCDRYCCLPVLEGGCRSVAFIFDVELIQLQVPGEAL